MNLTNFETNINGIILARGLAYYEAGHVLSLEPQGNTWIAAVAGNECYTVGVTLSDSGDVLDCACNCPYDWSDFCKHLAAVLYTLREEFTPEAVSARVAEKERFERILNKLDRQALLSIVLEFVNKDRQMKEMLLLRYAEPGDLLQSARNAIQGAIKAVNRRGFMRYEDVPRATMGAEMVFQVIYETIDSGDNVTAVSLCMIVLEELIELSARCDDADDLVGDMIFDALNKMESTLGSAPLWDHAAILKQLEQYIAERQSVLGGDCHQLQELQDVILDRFEDEA
jgi:uncharacterized Zn finger protein